MISVNMMRIRVIGNESFSLSVYVCILLDVLLGSIGMEIWFL